MILITLRPNMLMERTLVLRCTLFMATSMGTVTKRSISCALRPGHCVTMMICVLVTSGKASMGVLRKLTNPAITRMPTQK